MDLAVQLSYFAAAVLFIIGLKAMSSPVTARRGVMWAGVGMVIATVATLFHPSVEGVSNIVLIFIAIVIGGGFAWYTAIKVKMTEMPQMVAVYNGLGGGSAGAIAAVSLLQGARAADDTGVATQMGSDVAVLALLGGVIGSVAFSGSMIAWAKLDERFKKSTLVENHQWWNVGLAVLTLLLAVWVYHTGSGFPILLFFIAALALGIFITVPIGGADMPVVISLFNALTGLAVGFKGYVLGNLALIIAGTVVGAAGMLLTFLMAKAMNRSLANILFSGFGAAPAAAQSDEEGEMREVGPEDGAYMMAYADRVIIVPGYGLAVAQAQHKLWEMVELLHKHDVDVKFAIHPVAGRMPGHMNVLLAEAGVPYDMIFDMDEINEEFEGTDVVLIIGANDVVNPAAREDEASPIYGMPILNVDYAENVLVVKRGRGAGFSGVENKLFLRDNTRMVFGDAQKVVGEMVQTVKGM
ncbi:NAD(P)(+) transhydrogenase (Re/Si-specific) subunit beta [Halorhodospira halochloris]|uniref:NAD(P) transhydrogenase subunit beta n=1 Tax=Halorhodospira halochloris TaxID=1052 RepID=A0A0X8X744_HALHR|nr:NAD(P)(+) transhydrogenase (Re/Si-specific) subunit beta [Halorhodospira halochloris]MBK1650656.1 NAD(P) transhydrogenase subunit beta [Halorhodospira halochloris]MCG5529765.1 NAD(P)(+) transhydrogenase (Re/Si-specific) subunit beta [Halorhodospira halochloris]BAU56857.1 NAD(P) transhydrogenase subunit beta [Halorhodospira halochloris]